MKLTELQEHILKGAFELGKLIALREGILNRGFDPTPEQDKKYETAKENLVEWSDLYFQEYYDALDCDDWKGSA